MWSISSSGYSAGRPRRSLRWIAVLLASVLLHLVAFNWASGHITLPSLRDEPDSVITTALLAEPKKIEPPAPVAVPPKRQAKSTPRRRAAPAPAPARAAETATAAPVLNEFAPFDDGPAASETATVSPTEEPATADGAPAEAKTQYYRIDPPPSAELEYDVKALRDGQQWYGSGMFQWTSMGTSYRIAGEASITVLFKITVLNFRSEGAINDSGIAPVLYSEKPWRKSMTNTHFRREDRKISFSASEAVYPYKGGEQDRASIMWQLAGVGRGDPSQFVPGAMLEIVVAGARKAETWRIQVVGEEEIETGYGKMRAWHVVRAPLDGSYEQKIDIWLAPQHEWYPVKLRYTYPNGDHLDMALSDLKQAVPVAQAAQ